MTRILDYTIILLKPDIIERSLEKNLRERLEGEGLKINIIGQILIDLDFVKKFYGWSVIKHIAELTDYLCRKPLSVWLIEGRNAIQKVCNIKREMRLAYCSGRLCNLFHCPDSEKDFEREYELINLSLNSMRTNNQVEVIVFTQKEGNLLFLLLKRNPEKGNFWQPITGNVEVGETFKEAALRELKEEIGISKILRFIDTNYSFEFFDDDRQQYERVFGVEIEPDSAIILSHEHTNFVWVEEGKAIDNYLKYPGNKEGIRKLVEKIREQTNG